MQTKFDFHETKKRNPFRTSERERGLVRGLEIGKGLGLD